MVIRFYHQMIIKQTQDAATITDLEQKEEKFEFKEDNVDYDEDEREGDEETEEEKEEEEEEEEDYDDEELKKFQDEIVTKTNQCINRHSFNTNLGRFFKINT